MPHLSLRYQLGLALIVVNVLLSAGVALFAYRAAHDAMVDQALASVSLVSQSRERELVTMLQHRQERFAAFLQSLRSLCGESGPRGGFGFEDECVRTATSGFHRSAIASVVDSAVESVRPSADAKGVEVVRTLAAPLLTLQADPRRLQQIVWNLLSNAVRFTPAGGRVDVIVSTAGDDMELTVTDTGCGISPEFLPHVFERFRQADSSTTRTHGGLGLGLAIVRDRVALHGGTVQADSRGEGQGATFTVRLPMRAARPAQAVSLLRPAEAARLTGARVLVVDDDPDTRDVLRAILEGAGAEVITSASARESREMFQRAHPSLLIADLGMAEEDGFSLIASIRHLETGTSHVPAIALTAHTRPEDVEHAIAAGFQLHVAKPVDAGQLVESIATLVAHPT